MNFDDQYNILIEKYELLAFDRVIGHGILIIFKQVSTWLDFIKIWAYFWAILYQNDPKPKVVRKGCSMASTIAYEL